MATLMRIQIIIPASTTPTVNDDIQRLIDAEGKRGAEDALTYYGNDIDTMVSIARDSINRADDNENAKKYYSVLHRRIDIVDLKKDFDRQVAAGEMTQADSDEKKAFFDEIKELKNFLIKEEINEILSRDQYWLFVNLFIVGRIASDIDYVENMKHDENDNTYDDIIDMLRRAIVGTFFIFLSSNKQVCLKYFNEIISYCTNQEIFIELKMKDHEHMAKIENSLDLIAHIAGEKMKQLH